MSVNKVILIGNVGREPNVRYIDRDVAVASLSLATVSTTEMRFVNLSEIEFELLSDEEIEAELLNGGNTNEEHL
jgi:hypothetical protein